jgi:hypothetical protein
MASWGATDEVTRAGAVAMAITNTSGFCDYAVTNVRAASFSVKPGSKRFDHRGWSS